MNKKYVYLLKTSSGLYKIGVSKDVSKRIKQLQTGSIEEIFLVNKFLSAYPFKIESTLHRRFSLNHVTGEWFELSSEDVNGFLDTCSLMEKNFKCLDYDPFPSL